MAGLETAADRASFFDEDEHGTAVTYTPDGGAPVAITILFDRLTDSINAGVAGIVAPTAVARVNIDDLAAAPDQDDQIAVPGVGTFIVDNAYSEDPDTRIYTLDLRPA